MNNTNEVSIVVRGKVIDSQIFQTVVEAESYKTAARNWGRSNGVVVSVMTRVPAGPVGNARHWLLRAKAS